MKQIHLSLFVLSGISLAVFAPCASSAGDPLVEATRKIGAEITENGKAYRDLRELTTIGPRLSGSEGAAKAVEWAKRKMESYGFDRVILQPTMVPHWTRGDVEQATVTSTPHPISLKVAALGNSVGTHKDGVEAGVVEVQSLDEVKSLGAAVRGKIVFYNRPMDPVRKNTFKAYARAVDQRVGGASVAAKQGAVAVLVRSLTTLPDDDYPHTGMVSYEKDIDMIPAAALSIRSANELSALLKSDPRLTVNLKLSAAQHPPVSSFNVIGELSGREIPQEYVVVGGHLDSWDLGTGAHDDGAGVVQSIEVLRALKTLGMRPRRTVRVVLFMAEELGAFGAKEYASQAKAKGEKHVAAIESDSGGFAPVGFSVEGSDGALAAVKRWASYLAPLHAESIEKGGSGVDVAPLGALGAVTLGLVPDSTHYFDFHHSARDRIEAVDIKELHAGAAAMAILAYLLAEKGISDKAETKGEIKRVRWASAAPAKQNTYRVKRMKDNPNVDADWNKAAWKDIMPVTLEHYMGKEPAHQPRVRARAAYDDDSLYLIWKVEDQFVLAKRTKHQQDVWRDSCVEFFFTPGGDPKERGYFNLETSCAGVKLFGAHVPGSKDGKFTAEDFASVVTASSLKGRIDPEIAKPTTWTLEYKIPFSLLEKFAKIDRPKSGVTWRANFYKCADDTSHPHWLTWSPISSAERSFHVPMYFGILAFE
jgi:hypothetical protein